MNNLHLEIILGKGAVQKLSISTLPGQKQVFNKSDGIIVFLSIFTCTFSFGRKSRTKYLEFLLGKSTTSPRMDP